MRIRWRLVLPLLGLVVFGVVTKSSFYIDRVVPHNPHRYFWWSSVQLDPDPLNRRHHTIAPCRDGQENCASWELLRDTWVEPSWIAEGLMLSALPAFIAGAVIVRGLGHLGVNEVWSFLISMPLLIFAWYYFIGQLIDRLKSRRTQRSC